MDWEGGGGGQSPRPSSGLVQPWRLCWNICTQRSQELRRLSLREPVGLGTEQLSLRVQLAKCGKSWATVRTSRFSEAFCNAATGRTGSFKRSQGQPT